MSSPDTDSVVEDVGSDRLRGVSQIARFLNERPRRIAYLIEIGALPVGREATAIIASKSKLRECHHRLTSGEIGGGGNE